MILNISFVNRTYLAFLDNKKALCTLALIHKKRYNNI